MNTPNELYQWLPADERLLKLIREGKAVLVRNRLSDPFQITYPKQTNLELLRDYQYEYVPPTAPEVKELPDCEGSWWYFCENTILPETTGFWFHQMIHAEDVGLFSDGEIPKPENYPKYWVSAEHHAKPNFNPETGEKL